MSGDGSRKRKRLGPVRLAAFGLALAVSLCLWSASATAAVVLDEGPNTVVTPNLEWDFGNGVGGQVGNPERVEGLKWRGSGGTLGPNLAAAGGGACNGEPSEFWGQSYGNADGQGPGPVVAGSAGGWRSRGTRSVEINTVAPTNCSGDEPPIPVRTRYSFFDAGAAANTVRVERRWTFAPTQEPYLVQGMRAYVPRLSSGTYNQVVYPKADGTLAVEGLCNVCLRTDWKKTWVALNASSTNAGMLILRDPANASPASITVDFDGSSGSNNTGITLDRPLPGGWTAPLTETEYLCFYDETSWPLAKRATELPQGCAAITPPINTQPPAISAGAGSPRAGEQFFAAPGVWDNATGAFTYQWSRCGDSCQQIGGATGTSYTATAPDAGKSLKVRVTATGTGGETEVAESNIAGAISGHVYEGGKDGPTVASAQVQVCRRSGSPCRSTTTDGSGFYEVQAPMVGKFRVTAFPPAGSNAVSRTRPTLTRVKAEADTTGQDVVLGVAKPPPPQVGLSGSGVRSGSAASVPVVHWQEPFVIEYETDLDKEVEARIEFGDGQQLLVQPLRPVLPSPKDAANGIYRFPIQPLIPNHGAARVTIVERATRTPEQLAQYEQEVEEEEEEEQEEEDEEEEEEEENEEEDEEPEEDEETEDEENEEEDNEEEEEDEENEDEENEEDEDDEETIFPIYIDPSGFVRGVNGAPLGGATVTLFQAASKAGPFTVVPNGSAAMSPMNRRNSDLSEVDGHFGWDVIAGFYKVRVEKAGCHAPALPGQGFVETAVMTIPPPVTNLDLRLDCPTPGAGTPPPVSVPPAAPPAGPEAKRARPLKCKKGFRKKRAHGKVRCVKVKRKHRPRR